MIRLGLEDYRPAVEKRSITLADFPQLMLNAPIASGVSVTEDSALEWMPFLNGVVLISQDVGRIPRRPFEKKDDDSREKLDGSYLDRLLRQPNPYINDLDLWSTIMAHALVWGDGYFEIEWDRALRPIALWPILPEYMAVKMENNRLTYIFRSQKPIQPEDIIHIKGPSYDGLTGRKIVGLARQAIGLGLALERFGAAFFGNGAIPGVVLEMPGTFKDQEAATRYTKSWNELMRGPDRAHQTAVLQNGLTAKVLGTTQENSQYIESKDAQVVEAARMLNIPPHKLKHKMGERPGANLTESEQDYLNNTLDPWLVRIEQELNRKLIPRAQRSSWYVEHDRNAYLRMTPDQRAQSYKVYFDMGVLDAEAIAKKENLPKPEPPPEPPPVKVLPPADPAALPQPKPMMMNSLTLAADRANLMAAVDRFVKRETTAARRAAKKGPGAFSAWAEEFYQDEMPVFRGFLVPAVRISLACRGLEGDAEGVSATIAARYVARSKEDLLGLPARDLEGKADRMLTRWEEGRAGELADEILTMRGTELVAPRVTVTVNVPQQPPPAVTVNVPEQAPPSVNVTVPEQQVTVNVPQQKPPDVRVDAPVTVNVPPQMAPDVNVTVPAPIVRVDAPVTVNVPSPAPLKVERDAYGVITGISPKKG